MRLRFDEATLTKNPLNPISTDVTPSAPPSVANYMDLCHLPADCLAWLFTRTTAQVNAAAMVAKTAHEAGSPISGAALLRTDHNVLVLLFPNGTKLAVYPDGAIGHEGQVLACTPEEVQSVIGAGQEEGMGIEVGADMGEQVPTDPMNMTGDVSLDGMDNLAGPAGMEDEALGEPALGALGDPIEMAEPMIDSEFYGTKVGGDPTDQILGQVGAASGPSDLNLALLDTKGMPMRGERRLRR